MTLSVPSGAGSYQYCTHGSSCGSVDSYCATVNAGTSYTWTYNLDGACPGNDNYAVFIRVSPGGAPAFECSPYTISYTFQSGLCLN